MSSFSMFSQRIRESADPPEPSPGTFVFHENVDFELAWCNLFACDWLPYSSERRRASAEVPYLAHAKYFTFEFTSKSTFREKLRVRKDESVEKHRRICSFNAKMR